MARYNVITLDWFLKNLNCFLLELLETEMCDCMTKVQICISIFYCDHFTF